MCVCVYKEKEREEQYIYLWEQMESLRQVTYT